MPTNNTPPIAQADNFETFSDPIAPSTLVGELLGNDGDPDGDVIAINTTPVTLPAQERWSLILTARLITRLNQASLGK